MDSKTELKRKIEDLINDSIKIRAWIEVGVERRETIIEMPYGEFLGVLQHCHIEDLPMEYVQDWLPTQYRFGWSWDQHDWDFGYNCGMLGATTDSALPGTRAYRVDLGCEQIRCPDCSEWMPPPGPEPAPRVEQPDQQPSQEPSDSDCGPGGVTPAEGGRHSHGGACC